MRSLSVPLLFLALVILQFACVHVRPIHRDGSPALDEDEGVLVVHLDTNVPVARLGFSGSWAFLKVPPGVHFVPLVVTAGNYRWDRVQIGKRRYRIDDDKYWDFRVEPGQLNYAGQLVVPEPANDFETPRF